MATGDKNKKPFYFSNALPELNTSFDPYSLGKEYENIFKESSLISSDVSLFDAPKYANTPEEAATTTQVSSTEIDKQYEDKPDILNTTSKTKLNTVNSPLTDWANRWKEANAKAKEESTKGNAYKPSDDYFATGNIAPTDYSKYGADETSPNKETFTKNYVEQSKTNAVEHIKENPDKPLFLSLAQAKQKMAQGENIDLETILDAYKYTGNKEKLIEIADKTYAEQNDYALQNKDVLDRTKQLTMVKNISDSFSTNDLNYDDRKALESAIDITVNADPAFENINDIQKQYLYRKLSSEIESNRFKNNVKLRVSPVVDVLEKRYETFSEETNLLIKNKKILLEANITAYRDSIQKDLQAKVNSGNYTQEQFQAELTKADRLLKTFSDHMQEAEANATAKEIELLKYKYDINERSAETIKNAYTNAAVDIQNKELAKNKRHYDRQGIVESIAQPIASFGLGTLTMLKQSLDFNTIFNPLLESRSTFDIEIDELRKTVSPELHHETNLDAVTDYNFWATKGAETLPLTLLLMYGGAAGTAALSRAFPAIGAFANANVFTQMAAAQIISRPMESLLEGSSAYSEAIMNGMTKDQAADAAFQTAIMNLPLAALDLASALPFLKAIPKNMAQQIAQAGISTAIEFGTEGSEEVLQGWMQENAIKSAEGKEYSLIDHIYNKTTGEINRAAFEEFALGGGTSLLFSGTGLAKSTYEQYKFSKMQMEQDKKFENITAFINDAFANGVLSRDPATIYKLRTTLYDYYNKYNSDKISEKEKEDLALKIDPDLYNRAMTYLNVLEKQPMFIEATANMDMLLEDADKGTKKFTKGEPVYAEKTQYELWHENLRKLMALNPSILPEDEEQKESLWDLIYKSSVFNRNKLTRDLATQRILDRYTNKKSENQEVYDELIAENKIAVGQGILNDALSESERLAAIMAIHKAGIANVAKDAIAEFKAKEADYTGIEEKNPGEIDAVVKLLEHFELTGDYTASTESIKLIQQYPEVQKRFNEARESKEKYDALQRTSNAIEEYLETANETWKSNSTFRKAALDYIHEILLHENNKLKFGQAINKTKEGTASLESKIKEAEAKIKDLEKALSNANNLKNIGVANADAIKKNEQNIRNIKDNIDTQQESIEFFNEQIKSLNDYRDRIIQLESIEDLKAAKIKEYREALKNNPVENKSLLKSIGKLAKKIFTAKQKESIINDRTTPVEDTFVPPTEEELIPPDDVFDTEETSTTETPGETADTSAPETVTTTGGIEKPELPTMEEALDQLKGEEFTAGEKPDDLPSMDEALDLKVNDVVKVLTPKGGISTIVELRGDKALLADGRQVLLTNLELVTEETKKEEVIHDNTPVIDEAYDLQEDELYDELSSDNLASEYTIDGLKNTEPVESIAYLDLDYVIDSNTKRTTTETSNTKAFPILSLNNVKAGDKVELVVLDSETFEAYTDKDGNLVTFESLADKGSDFIPIAVYHKGTLIGYIHDVDWINLNNVAPKDYTIEELKTQLSNLRKQLVENGKTTTTIKTANLGKLRLTIDDTSRNTAESLPDEKIVMLVGNSKDNQLLQGEKEVFNGTVIPNRATSKIHAGLKYAALPVGNRYFITPLIDVRLKDYNYKGINAESIVDTILEVLNIHYLLNSESADDADQAINNELYIKVYELFNLDLTLLEDLEKFIQLFIPTTSITYKSDLLEKSKTSTPGYTLKKIEGRKNERSYFGIVPTEKGVFLHMVSDNINLSAFPISDVVDRKNILKQIMLATLSGARMNAVASMLNTDEEFNLPVMVKGELTVVPFKNYNEYAKSTTVTPLVSQKLGDTDEYSYFAQRVVRVNTDGIITKEAPLSANDVEVYTPTTEPAKAEPAKAEPIKEEITTEDTVSETESNKSYAERRKRYYGSPANRMVQVQKDSENTPVTQEQIEEIEQVIEKAKELGWDKNRLLRQLSNMGYSYAFGVNPEGFRNYLEDRLSGKTNIKVTSEYNFFSQLDAEVDALEQPTQQAPVSEFKTVDDIKKYFFNKAPGLFGGDLNAALTMSDWAIVSNTLAKDATDKELLMLDILNGRANISALQPAAPVDKKAEIEKGRQEELIETPRAYIDPTMGYSIEYLVEQGAIAGPIVQQGKSNYLRIKEGVDNLNKKINDKYDAKYVDAVNKGEMTKEQAMQALEEVGRKDSDVYKQLASTKQPQQQIDIQTEIEKLEKERQEELKEYPFFIRVKDSKNFPGYKSYYLFDSSYQRTDEPDYSARFSQINVSYVNLSPFIKDTKSEEFKKAVDPSTINKIDEINARYDAKIAALKGTVSDKKADIERRIVELQERLDEEKYKKEKEDILNSLTKNILPDGFRFINSPVSIQKYNSQENRWIDVNEEILSKDKDVLKSIDIYFNQQGLGQKISNVNTEYKKQIKPFEEKEEQEDEKISKEQSKLLSSKEGILLRKDWSLGKGSGFGSGVDGITELDEVDEDGNKFEATYYLNGENDEWIENSYFLGKTKQEVIDKINAKYDAELDALNNTAVETQTQTLTPTEAAATAEQITQQEEEYTEDETTSEALKPLNLNDEDFYPVLSSPSVIADKKIIDISTAEKSVTTAEDVVTVKNYCNK